MGDFLQAIPAAASNPYALAAYAICAILFVVAGANLRKIRSIMRQIQHVPKNQRKQVIEIATETKLPESISTEDWIRLNRMRWLALIGVSVILALTAVSVIALTAPDQTLLQPEFNRLQDSLQVQGDRVSDQLAGTQDTIIAAVQDAALANLEIMFPLTVRIDRDVDGTIMHLDGSERQRVISYDQDLTPMKLYWGDRFHYFVIVENRRELPEDARLFLEIRNSTGSRELPIRLDPYSEAEIRIPGSTPEPFEAYLINPSGFSKVSLKITVYSADRERGREQFREALMQTSLASRARQIYKSVTVDGLRLRVGPGEDQRVLRVMRKDTYVKVLQTEGPWSRIRLPERREGWVLAEYLAQIQ